MQAFVFRIVKDLRHCAGTKLSSVSPPSYRRGRQQRQPGRLRWPIDIHSRQIRNVAAAARPSPSANQSAGTVVVSAYSSGSRPRARRFRFARFTSIRALRSGRPPAAAASSNSASSQKIIHGQQSSFQGRPARNDNAMRRVLGNRKG